MNTNKPVVMILAAGKGKRMQPLTDVMPKPLLLAKGFPLIGYQIEKFSRFGVSKFVVNTSHLEEMFGIYFHTTEGNQAFKSFGVEQVLLSSESAKALETAGGIAKALPLITDENKNNAPFFVVSSDAQCDADFESFYNNFADKLQDGEAALLLIKNPGHNKNGDFYFDPQSDDKKLGEIKNRFYEMPRNFNKNNQFNKNKFQKNNKPERPNFERPKIELDPNRQTFTYSGIGIFTPKFFDGVNPNYPKKLSQLFTKALKEGRLYGEVTEAFWLDVGTPERLEKFAQHLEETGIPPRIMEYWEKNDNYLSRLNSKENK